MGARIQIKGGERFGSLVIIRETEPASQKNPKHKRRMVLCRCDCGNNKIISLSHIRHGSTISCGCAHKKYVSEQQKTHGDTGSRLYQCWFSMKRRSAKRVASGEVCGVFNEWYDYIKFREWSLNNGYDDSKVLCRNGDVGDYSPTNARWDTQQSNIEEGLAKTYTMNDPNGVDVVIHNMLRFCRENDLEKSCMRDVYNGTQHNHKGWTRS